MHATPRSLPSFAVCGVRVEAADLTAATAWVLHAAVQGRSATIHLCNAYVVALASRDSGYRALLNRGDLNLPDGMSVVRTARALGLPLRERASGTELVTRVLREGANLRHVFLGSTPEVCAALRDRLPRTAPEANILAVEPLPFRPLTAHEDESLIERLRDADADVVWVGLGTPKQDQLVDRLAGRVDAVLVPVGAAFDFLAGTKRRAPSWMQRLGLEWVHRLVVEPRRLWRRYLVGNLRYLRCSLRSRERLQPGHDA